MFKAWRLAAPEKLTQTGAAARLGVTQQTVSGWEKDTPPGPGMASQIEAVYGLPSGTVLAALFPEAAAVKSEAVLRALKAGQSDEDTLSDHEMRLADHERRIQALEDALREANILKAPPLRSLPTAALSGADITELPVEPHGSKLIGPDPFPVDDGDPEAPDDINQDPDGGQ